MNERPPHPDSPPSATRRADGPLLGIVLDFDGTITERDIGDKVVQRFAPGWQEGLTRLMSGEWSIGTLQLWEAQRLPFDRLPEMIDFALSVAKVRPGFHELLEYARGHGIHVEVASAGFEFYVTAILEREDLADLEAVVPKLVRGDGAPAGSAPTLDYPAATCDRIGLCKCERIWRLQRAGIKAVFVGDGMSDYCAAEEADMVFARSQLARYCDERGIPYTAYNDFGDVLAGVKHQVGS
jgi:2,3-diketo-5-methylthio-1-phosphopentane phosphatase